MPHSSRKNIDENNHKNIDGPCARPAAPWLMVLAAGHGSRLKGQTRGPKQFLVYRGAPLFWHSVATFAKYLRAGRSGNLDAAGCVLVFPEDHFEEGRRLALAMRDKEGLSALPLVLAVGGTRRQDSVKNGLAALPGQVGRILVHDSARPFFGVGLLERLVVALEAGNKAVIPALRVKDTIKVVDGEGVVCETLERARLRAVQTPQGFDVHCLKEAHERFNTPARDVTDDASLMELAGHRVATVPGEEENVKITTPEDLSLLKQGSPRTGFGYDVHRYGGNRPLRLGGVEIGGEFSISAHSDGDVLLHALMDALLGLVGKGDIGELFPDSDMAYDGADSKELLRKVLELVRGENVSLTHADLTVIAQKPKIGPHKEAIRQSVAALLELDPTCVNVKATTEEGLGFTGELLGIKACAVVTGLA